MFAFAFVRGLDLHLGFGVGIAVGVVLVVVVVDAEGLVAAATIITVLIFIAAVTISDLSQFTIVLLVHFFMPCNLTFDLVGCGLLKDAAHPLVRTLCQWESVKEAIGVVDQDLVNGFLRHVIFLEKDKVGLDGEEHLQSPVPVRDSLLCDA